MVCISNFTNKTNWLRIRSVVKAQSHLDVWHERVNTVRETHQHVQNWTCAPINHPLTCYKRVSNVPKPAAHRVDTVLSTFPKRFHSVCECVPACQTSIQRMLDVYVTCKFRAQRVRSDRSVVFNRATRVRLPYFPPLLRYDDSIKARSPAFNLLGTKLPMLTSAATLIFECICFTQLWHTPCVFGAGTLHVSIAIISRNDQHSFQNLTSQLQKSTEIMTFLPQIIRYFTSTRTPFTIFNNNLYWQSTGHHHHG